MSKFKINAANTKAQVEKFVGIKRTYESGMVSIQNYVAQMVRLKTADSHISQMAAMFADAATSDAERNRLLTTFRGQLKRGADESDGARDAMKRDRLPQYPTVNGEKAKDGSGNISYAVKWKEWPEVDPLAAQFRKECGEFLANPSHGAMSAVLSTMLEIGGISREALIAKQKEIIKQHDKEIADQDEMLEYGADALDHIETGDLEEFTASIAH